MSLNDSIAMQQTTSSKSSMTSTETQQDDFDNWDGYTSSSSSIGGSVPTTPNLLGTDSGNNVPFIDLSKLLFVNDFDFGFNNDNNLKKRFDGIKLKTKAKLIKYQNSKELQDLFNEKLSKFDKRLHQNLQSSSTEKLFYAISLFIIASAGFIIGKYPKYFPHFHTLIFVVLMPIRFYSYFKISFQYYLADLCYYVNLLLMLFIWVFPQSPRLFVSVFSLSLGTLSFAVITWRNSLVLHSIDKTTSSFIHIMPPVTMFVMVHELPADYVLERYPGIAAIDNWNLLSSIIYTSIYYTIWQVSYHYFISIRKHEQIKRGKVTSFQYLRNKNKSTTLGKFVNSLPYFWMQTLAFTLIQFMYQLLTMAFCPIWFKYKHACGCFVTFIFIWASYNGATYYVDIFGKRLEKEVDKLKNEIISLQQENSKLQTTTTTTTGKPNDIHSVLNEPVDISTLSN
ncbi:uncharacterized protein J8A68_002829 [[Candida] subhashii]|uniref:Glycerophosphocholine acyltransferase 1 n=1 Tax=[Candida] subhashii TaxID=561895 RepID=A0A8J5QWL0_9ASCO|nr:uncharacterized protein J8A68_002829 [[Candida] subhashii]KAG7663580.1 hypothetical protein J8A68_002829 [[Candida] subhashii]